MKTVLALVLLISLFGGAVYFGDPYTKGDYRATFRCSGFEG